MKHFFRGYDLMTSLLMGFFVTLAIIAVFGMVGSVIGSTRWSQHCMAQGGDPSFLGRGGGLCIRDGLIIDTTGY